MCCLMFSDAGSDRERRSGHTADDQFLPGTPGLLCIVGTFFGTMRVTSEQNGRFHVLRHGTTTHGRQDRRGPGAKVPLDTPPAGAHREV